MAQSFAVRGFRGFEEWTEFQGGRISVLQGPNSSGKSRLISAYLLIAAQTDPWRLSFAGGIHRLPSFRDSLTDCDQAGRMEFILRFSLDAVSALLPQSPLRPEPVYYDFEFYLAYAADPFDGGTSGLLVECRLDFTSDDKRIQLFSAKSFEGGGDLFLATEEVLHLPFVRARAVEAASEAPDAVAAIDASIEIAGTIGSSAGGEVAAKAIRIRSSLEAVRKEALLDREFERLVLSDPRKQAGRSLFQPRGKKGGYESEEPKYLRSLADILVAESLSEFGIRSMRSVESGREIRLSFYSVFHELLAGAGFLQKGHWAPPFLFPAQIPAQASSRPDCGSARGASALALAALGDYSALLRDAINHAACRREDGSYSIEHSRLCEAYGRAIIDRRESRGSQSLIEEGREADPLVLDLESRRKTLSDFLKACGLASDLEFNAGASEEFSISLALDGRRQRIGELPQGLRRLVLVAVALLYLPWGSLVVIEEPESGLDAAFRTRMAELLRILSRGTGATLLVETRNEDFVAALGPYLPASASATKACAKESVDGLVRVLELPASRRRPAS
ncbi:MAG: AAA family ATPase [Spirochaetota bacterium]